MKKFEDSLKKQPKKHERKINEFFEYERVIGKRIVNGQVSYLTLTV